MLFYFTKLISNLERHKNDSQPLNMKIPCTKPAYKIVN